MRPNDIDLVWSEDECTRGLPGHVYVSDQWKILFNEDNFFDQFESAKIVKTTKKENYGDCFHRTMSNGYRVFCSVDGYSIYKPINVYAQADLDYKKAKDLGLTNKKRWEDGINHHSMSERIVRFLVKHDCNDYGDYFCWKVGGDGDNGETLMYQLDTFFEMIDNEK